MQITSLIAAVIVNADGELVAQELENGFDRGAMEAIHEYLAGKGIAWEPEAKETEACSIRKFFQCADLHGDRRF